MQHHDNWLLIGWWSNDVIKDIKWPIHAITALERVRIISGLTFSHFYLLEKVEKDVRSLRHLTCDGLSTIIMLFSSVSNSFGLSEGPGRSFNISGLLDSCHFLSSQSDSYIYTFFIIFHDSYDHNKERTPFDVEKVYWT